MNSAFKDFKKGTRVEDLWYKEWGVGVVVKRSKTRLHVRFPSPAKQWTDGDGVMTWDGPHVRAFLRKVRNP